MHSFLQKTKAELSDDFQGLFKKPLETIQGRLRSQIIALVAKNGSVPLAVVAMVIIADLSGPS